LYAATAGDFSDGYGDVSHAYKSTNGGDTWTELTAVRSACDINARRYLSNQAWYDNVVVVSPTNANVVLLAGVSYLQSTDGTAWRNVLGADGFECAVNAWASDIAYATTQHGGVFRTENAGSASAPAFTRVSPKLESATEFIPFFTLITAAYAAPKTLYTASST